MTPMHHQSRSTLRLCRLTLAGASWIVPFGARSEWRQEWEAELWHRVLLLERHGLLSVGARVDLWRRCLGAYRHAAWLLGREFGSTPLLRDARAAARDLRATPVPTGLTIAALGLSIGLAAAVFGMVDQALLRPGSAATSRLVQVWNSAPAAGLDRSALSAAEFAIYRKSTRTLEGLAAFRAVDLTLGTGDESAVLQGALVTPQFLTVLGSPLELGSGFMRNDFARDAEPAVILGNELWQARFGSDPEIVGKQVLLDGRAHRVAGVAAAGLRLPGLAPELWLPLRPTRLFSYTAARQYRVIGRLKRGVTRGDAGAELSGLSRRLQAAQPENFLGPLGIPWGIAVDPWGPAPVQAPLLRVVLAAAMIAPVAAAASAAAYAGVRRQLSRRGHKGRQRGRRRGWLRAAWCAGLGGVCAGAMVTVADRSPLRWIDAWLPEARSLPMGSPLLFVATASLVVLGVMLVAEQWSGWVRGSRGHALPAAVSTWCAGVLLAGALVFGNSYRSLKEEGPGFQAEGLYALLARPLDGVSRTESRAEQLEQWRRNAATRAGVQSAAFSAEAPFGRRTYNTTFELERWKGPSPLLPPLADLRVVSPEYFRVMGLPLRAGPGLSEGAGFGVTDEVVVNQAFVDRFLPGIPALGERVLVVLEAGTVTQWLTVVGIVGDVRGRGLTGASAPELYLPAAAWMDRISTLVVRATQPIEELGQAVDIGRTVSRALAPQRWAALIVASLAVGALLASAATCWLLTAGPEPTRGRPRWTSTALRASTLGAVAGGGAFWLLLPFVSGLVYRGGVPQWSLAVAGALIAAGVCWLVSLVAPRARPCR